MIIFKYAAKRLLSVFFLVWTVLPEANGQELIPLEISQQKSVHILFPSAVKYCDAGVPEVHFKVTENIVKLISGGTNLPETNLTVITEDNYLYTFLVLYKNDPRRLSVLAKQKDGKLVILPKAGGSALDSKEAGTNSIDTNTAVNFPVEAAASPSRESEQITAPVLTESTEGVGPDSAFFDLCTSLINRKKSYSMQDIEMNVSLQVPNIYTLDDYLFVEVHATNRAGDDFFVDFVNFQQSQRKGIFRKIYREELKKPVYIFNKNPVFKENQIYYMVYVFEKFSIDKGKKLLIEMGEKNGDRFLSLAINSRAINEARVLEVEK